ncbi:hypothetical protein SAMN05216303_1011088 [Rhodoferax sp. OV413]|nr:hypothetical protein SAMN05216303_1011088 [Rhodoferax sp. OV413]
MCAVGRDVRPAAQSLSFAWSKESNQRKGHPHSPRPLRGNLRCMLLAGERSNSLRSDNRAPNPAKSMQRRRFERGTPDAGADSQPGCAGRRALGAMGRVSAADSDSRGPLCMRRGAQLQVDQGWRCLSVASLARPHLQRAPQVSAAKAEDADSGGGLSFGDFSLATQRKVTAPPGAHPGLLIDVNHRPATRNLTIWS